MTLTPAEVERIAALARLRLDPAEVERYARDLSAILEYADHLQQVDTEGVQPAAGAPSTPTPLRADEPRPGLTSGELLANAPDVEAGQFRVPPVLGAGPQQV